jgi:hypothetical protein
MDSDFTVYMCCGISLVIAIAAISAKILLYNRLRKKQDTYLHFKLFSFYSEEHIFSTTSPDKRWYMNIANRTTILMYASLLPVILWLVSNLIDFMRTLPEII